MLRMTAKKKSKSRPRPETRKLSSLETISIEYLVSELNEVLSSGVSLEFLYSLQVEGSPQLILESELERSQAISVAWFIPHLHACAASFGLSTASLLESLASPGEVCREAYRILHKPDALIAEAGVLAAVSEQVVRLANQDETVDDEEW